MDMPTETDELYYAALIEIRGEQNVQELATIWGEMENELIHQGVEVEDVYVALGNFDFLVHFNVSDTDSAYQASAILEQQGFQVELIQLITTDKFGSLVADL